MWHTAMKVYSNFYCITFEELNVRWRTVNSGSEDERSEIPAADVGDCPATYLDVIRPPFLFFE